MYSFVSGNVQQHCDLHRGASPGRKPQSQRDAHIPVRQCQRQVRPSTLYIEKYHKLKWQIPQIKMANTTNQNGKYHKLK